MKYLWPLGAMLAIMATLYAAGLAYDALPKLTAVESPTIPGIKEQQPPEAPKREASRIAIGAKVRLSLDGQSPVFVSDTPRTLKRVEQLAIAGDTLGLAALVDYDKLYPVRNGTRALVLDVGLFTSEVRILEGDFTGRLGVVKTVWIKP